MSETALTTPRALSRGDPSFHGFALRTPGAEWDKGNVFSILYFIWRKWKRCVCCHYLMSLISSISCHYKINLKSIFRWLQWRKASRKTQESSNMSFLQTIFLFKDNGPGWFRGIHCYDIEMLKSCLWSMIVDLWMFLANIQKTDIWVVLLKKGVKVKTLLIQII